MQLSDYFIDWGKPTQKPFDPTFEKICQDVPGMSTPSILQVLSILVSGMKPGQIYFEVGSFCGRTLVGALTNNTANAMAVDNFSEFVEVAGQTHLEGNIKRYGLQDRVSFFKMDIFDYFKEFIAYPEVGVYFYDGEHSENSTYIGLSMAFARILYKGSYIVVDDYNFPAVKNAVQDFCRIHDVSIVYEVETPDHPNPLWWNGLCVMRV